MVAMPRHRSAATTTATATAALAAALLLGACAPSGDGAVSSTSAPAGTTTTTIPVWVGGPEEDIWWALDEVCHAANDAALADAREVLTLSTTPDPDRSVALTGARLPGERPLLGDLPTEPAPPGARPTKLSPKPGPRKEPP